jgi:hypothetical protein
MSADTGLLLQAVISIAVILVVVLAAALAFVLLRRGSGHGRGFLTRVRPRCPAARFRFITFRSVHLTRILWRGNREAVAIMRHCGAT